MNLSRPQIITVAVTAIAAVALIVAIVIESMGEPQQKSDASVVRADSHVLDKGETDKAVLVEFLDFECEACGAAYPFIEDLRKQYKGELTFVVRYFPGQGHTNALPAAHAAEAAARQDKLQEMYSKLFSTQKQWGEQRESQADLFRTYAEDIGLDMDQYDKDVDSKSVADRVQSDFDDGVALGATGTPTFFFNGKKFTPQSADDFAKAIDEALAN